MGVNDGTVHPSAKKIVDHGPNSLRWNLVILAEGYRKAELDRYHHAADAFVEKLFNTPPFRQMWCAINVHRVDVESLQSGADEPATCADGENGSGTTVRTYFDAAFCREGIGRYLYGDKILAQTTANNAVPGCQAAIVIVNSTRYGGAGGPVAWFSQAATADEIGVHELCHTAFHLADEFGGVGSTWTAGEPSEPNVTTITDRATTKWASRIAATTPVPTQSNPAGCKTMTTDPSPVPAGTVGLFAGGSHAYCGIYHAEYGCRMHKLGDPFCKVCSDTIVARLRQHLPKFSGPIVGTQFHGSLAAGETKRWFTYSWPACWHVLWTVMPTTPVTPGPALRHKVRVERTSRERITYWISVTNESKGPVEFDARYEIVVRN